MNQDIEVGVDHRPPQPSADPAILSPLNTREHGLLATYDFTKHMSMLSLVAMGGMLGLLQGNGGPFPKHAMQSIFIVGLAGFLSVMFMATAAVTQVSQRAHKTSKWIALGMIAAIFMSFTFGVEMFFVALTRAGAN